MKTIRVLAAFVLLFVGNWAIAQDDEGLVKEHLREKYMQFLRDEGYQPSVDGDVMFKKEGTSYYLRPEERNFFKMTRYLNNSQNDQSLRLFKAVNYANASYKTVAVYSSADFKYVVVQSMSFLANEDDFKSFFSRALNSINSACDMFIEEYNK